MSTLPLNPQGGSNIRGTIERRYQGVMSDSVERNSNLGSANPYKGPTARTLFYEAGKRTPGKYGQFLFYSLGNNDNNFIDSYYKSENSAYNRSISSLKSKNPSAGFLIRDTADSEAVDKSNQGTITGGLSGNYDKNIIGGISAPYYWKDFLYARYYGTIPNNYMVTLRRFPTPVLDNLSVPDAIKNSSVMQKEGAGRPVAQAITWFGGNTGNKLNDLISFTTGLSFEQRTQEQTLTQNAFSKGFFEDLPYQWMSKLAELGTGYDLGGSFATIVNGMAIAFDDKNTTIENVKYQGLRELAKDPTRGGVMSEYIWVPVDTISKTNIRTAGLPFEWGPLSIVCEYDLTSVGEVNTKAAMLDLLASLLSIGTNYGNFLTPDFRYNSNYPALGFPGGDAGLEEFYRDPISFMKTYGAELTDIGKNAVASGNGEGDKNTIGGVLNIEKPEMYKVSDTTKIDYSNVEKGVGGVLKMMATTSFLEKYQAPASFLTGAPIGEWHLTIGNPCNPIAMIGNLICKGVKIEFNDILGPDDFPTMLKATYTLEHGRDRERGEIESIFNRGDGRLYQSAQPTSTSQQSYSAHMDTEGHNVPTTAAAGLSNTVYSEDVNNMIKR